MYRSSSIYLIIWSFLSCLIVHCTAQIPAPESASTPESSTAPKPFRTSTGLIGGRCDGCELMFAGMPAVMDAVDTSASWQDGTSRILVKGSVFKLDGKTPARDVIVYYYHTDKDGLYAPQPGMNEQARRHGHLRGWVKTDDQGHYAIYTNRPASYPNSRAFAHIHVFIKEPDLEHPYYIDEFVFNDDPLLTAADRKRASKRGGDGILFLKQGAGMRVADHDIILGLNVPNYPE